MAIRGCSTQIFGRVANFSSNHAEQQYWRTTHNLKRAFMHTDARTCVHAAATTDVVATIAIVWSAMSCSAVPCSAVPCSAVQCSAVQCSDMRCGAVRCDALHSCAARCTAELGNILHGTAGCSVGASQGSTVQCGAFARTAACLSACVTAR